jgi:hypothetical protein
VNQGSPTINEYVVDEDDVNLPYDEIEAIETELGLNPAGTETDVADRLDTIETALMPIGSIIMWSGLYSNIPTGFQLCNGTGGTPNLQHRFVRCTSGTENPGATGGADTTTLGITNLPSHNHSGSSNATFNHTHTTDSDGLHAHTMKNQNVFQTGTNRTGVFLNGTGTHAPGDPCVNSGYHTHTMSYSGTHSHTITVGFTGSGTAFNNMPLYYELCFIMKTS